MNLNKVTFKLLVTILLINVTFNVRTQSLVTLEDVWQNYTFYPKSITGVNWMKDGQYYTSIKSNKITKFDISTGKSVETLFSGNNFSVAIDAYSLSPKEDKLLIATEEEAIYRRSSKAYFYVYDLASGDFQPVSDLEKSKQLYATISPDGNFVAFVRDNNLFVSDLNSGEEKAITTDGEFNKIINGATDWVYEEEFSFAKAFFWSPDSKKIAFYTFDESQVKEYNMQVWQGGTSYVKTEKNANYPYDYRFKYPKAGEENSIIKISVYDLQSQNTTSMDIGSETDIYIPRINWTQDPNLLSIRRMNRLQNTLEILHADANSGSTQVILTEQSDTYVDLDFTDDLTYLKDGKSFIHSSEKSAYKHLYLYDMNGNLIRQITEGDWEVSELLGVDEENELVYFTSTENSPLERQIYSISLKGKNKTQLSKEAGIHKPDFSPDFKYYLDYYSNTQTPPQTTLNKAPSGKVLKVLEENSGVKNKLSNYHISYKEFFSFQTEEGVELNGWMIKPLDFDENKEYPLLMFVYGGPGNQQVMNEWESFNFFWYQVLASKGYVIVCVDNRGTGGRGEAFKKITYANLGKYEVQDQISAAKFLREKSFIDASRIGIWGWSYGGYMSSLCILLGNDVFKAAIAVAPVSSWRFYDTIYTERYLQTPQENAKGYDDFSPITHADKLKGNYLLIHGTGDDNVHFQNAVELQDALIKAGKQFESFYYPNRNHGIYGGNIRFHLYEMMTDFLERKLK